MKTLRRYMRENNLNQTEMARILDTDRYRMSRWLSGKTQPSLASVEKIAKATGAGIYQTMQEWRLI